MRAALAIAMLIVAGAAQAQYRPGPWIDPDTGYRYYRPYQYAPGRQYFFPPRNWYRGQPSYDYPDPHGFPRLYLPRVNCYEQPWKCPGPP